MIKNYEEVVAELLALTRKPMQEDYETDIQYPPCGAAEVLDHEVWAHRPAICRACGKDVSEKEICPVKDRMCPRFESA